MTVNIGFLSISIGYVYLSNLNKNKIIFTVFDLFLLNTKYHRYFACQ